MCAAIWLAACTADYDTFGTSDYNNFNDISFEEQTEDVSIDVDAHVITVRLAAPDSGKKLDSITVSGLKLSHLASLYIVESKFKEFPKDSAALDSLAREVAYSDDKIKTDSKVYLPASRILYLLVVSESGEPSIWKMVFTVGDEEPPAEENPGKEENDPSSPAAPKSGENQIVSIVMDNQAALSVVDVENKKVSVLLKYGVDIASGKVTEYKISEKAKISPDPKSLSVWAETLVFEITAENGDVASWTIETANVSDDFVAPELKSISLAGLAATIDNEKMTVTVNNLPFNKTATYSQKSTDLTDLTKIKITALDIVGSSDLNVGDEIDVSFGTDLKIASSGLEITYKVKGGYQYPNSDFGAWKNGSDGFTQLDGWDNGNNSYAKDLAVRATDEGRTVNKMTSTYAVIKFASGNSFTADFNPKGVKAVSMAGYADGNELIDFGKPFAGRPRYIEFDAKYAGKGDSCDMYIILESRSAGADAKNVDRATSNSQNTLVASAWYRATTISDSPNRPVPDLVSVKQIGNSGYSTVRMKLQYGAPLGNSPIFNSRVLDTVAKDLKKPDGIDNRLTPSSADEVAKLPVTHIRIVIASSAKGNEYEGSVGATLYVDEIRLIY